MKCVVCGLRDAVVMQRHTGRALCRECFIDDVVSRVKREIEKFSMFSGSDRLMIAASGGKDSYVLLDIILKLHDPSKIGVVTIIEGIEGYNRLEDIEKVRKLANASGVDVVVLSLKDYVGYSLTELVNLGFNKNVKVSPCTFCGVLRRKAINEVARDLGFTRVLTAHNLDDEVQTIIMNLLRGDLFRLVQILPNGPILSKLFVRKVKPLRKVYEEEVAIYAHLIGYEFQTTDCPYLRYFPSLRAKIREYLYKIEKEKPGVLLDLIERMDAVLTKYLSQYLNYPELPRCTKCGEPTAYGRNLCMACELLNMVGINSPSYRRSNYVKIYSILS
ncbi:MAG: TIGR00269 family protein [Thermoprotei archaeon]